VFDPVYTCRGYHDRQERVEAAMQYEDGVVGEQWTNSRAALVLTGCVAVLIDIAQRLHLPEESVIETRYGRGALGLWGEPLAAYQELKRLGQIPLDQSSTT
jgi:hypothetical protein